MQSRGIISGEKIFSRRQLTALCFPPASRRRKLHDYSGWDSSRCSFSHKGGNNRSSRNKVECFDISMNNEWVQASQSLTGSQRGRSAARCQSFPEPPRRRSAARYHRDSARRRSAARVTPDLEVCQMKPPTLRQRSIARATPD